MQTVNMHDAKTNLSKLVEKAAKGESFIIARAGKPLVKVVAIAHAEGPKPRIGFMKGRVSVPDNFDELGREEIAGLFQGS
ncbi:type II toxin-antitoxin system prevent-host-death family antitoxin [Phenylobacterium sp.]|jgi:prevent-host-death family protein|uniref:type II toxin-antitoxin system Phd/YefM family antitoxin n=1 Tax=Phenylobacterium sp. TaxID=1871053 RepID=UPI002E32664E|nr:type II toxin-antitoxin system prevent-host-death family antitoxin [Phenylobacterium sp.]HEX4713028.1 type II toxin-antitoxin system prevent-host-death family antitoxin [Phenylobacterium sp.]